MTTPRSTVIAEASMQSPSMPESLHSHTPENDPVVRVSQQYRTDDSWIGACRFSKHGEDEPAGNFFDCEPFREGSD
jgi:hypothetical protein